MYTITFYACWTIVNKDDSPPATFPPGYGNCEIIKTQISLTAESDQLFLNVNGQTYKITENIRIVQKNVQPRFFRVGFLKPEIDFLVCGEPPQLLPFFGIVETFVNTATNAERRKLNLKRSRFTKEINFCDLACLQTLNLSGNKLKRISLQIGCLPFLGVVNLSKNSLSEEKFDFLKSPIMQGSLQNLNISKNELTHVPEAVTHLRRVHTLVLSSNKIDQLPMNIGNLRTLRYLFLQKNLLQSLPGSIRQIKDLEILNLQKNLFGLKQEYVPLKFSVKTLKQAAAQVVVNRRCEYLSYNLPSEMVEYLTYEVLHCKCGRVMFHDTPTASTRPEYISRLAKQVLVEDFLMLPMRHYVCSSRCYFRNRCWRM